LNKPDDPYELLLKKINDDALMNKIKEAKLEGIYITSENYRYYPLGSLASQTVGFVAESDDGKIKGRYGLELYYDEILSGESGVFQGVRDAFGRLIRSVFSQEKQVKEGADIVTTIDKNIQFAAEQALEGLIKKRQAIQGSIIVMEVKTGKILALADYPTFDLNEFSKIKDYSIFRNFAIEERY
jgi:cell division protein FtsI (penicillin-binding protein 3)